MPNQIKQSQDSRVWEYLQTNGSITQLDAIIDLGVYRLASRIYNLKQMGVNISSKTINVENRFGETCHVSEYRLGL